MATFHLLGRIISHGHISSGFPPVRIAYPSLATILLSPSVEVSDNVLLETFLQTISMVDNTLVKRFLSQSSVEYSSTQLSR